MQPDLEAIKREIDRQLKRLQNKLDRLPPGREIHGTLTGDPGITSAMFALDVVKQALEGDDYPLQHLYDSIHPLQETK